MKQPPPEEPRAAAPFSSPSLPPFASPADPAAAAGAHRDDEAGLHARLTWLTAIRLAVVTALLAATTWFAFSPGGGDIGDPLLALLFGINGFIYAASLAYLWVLRRRRQLRWLAMAQVGGDVVVATFLVYITGGADSLFTLMYPLAIVNASILLGRPGAVAAALGSAAAFALLGFALDAGWVDPAAPYLAQRPASAARLAFVMALNGIAFLATAGLVTLLTEQVRRAGERLSEREIDYAALAELHRAVVRSMASGIITTDSGGRVLFMNPAAESITGLRFGQVVDEPLARRLPALWGAAQAALGRSEGFGQVDERGADGVRHLGFAVSALSFRRRRGRGGEEPGLALVIEDRTALRAAQEAVRRADRLAAVGELAAGLAHELRNPLASMSGAIELLAAGDRDAARKRLLDIVLRESARLEALVTDFLAFARPRPPALEPTDLVALADETLNVFRHDPAAARLELRRTGVGELRLRADASQLRQVLWNLLSNAADALEGAAGGAIVVDIGGAGRLARLSVADNGPGIAQEQQRQMFEPFFTTKPAGTGLGLALVHRIVEAHGGRIELQSEPGRGTTFTVLLPVEAPEPRAG